MGGRKGTPRRSGRRRALRWLALILLNLVLLELGAAALLGLRPNIFRGLALGSDERDARFSASIRRTLANRPDSLAEHDPELGWRPRPGLSNGTDDINRQRLRSQREYASLPAQDGLRVAAFGDSFVYGSEVRTNESWPSLVEQIRPGIEVLNYGVPGYGQDQIYLRFLAEARDLAPRIVLFGVSTPTLARIVTVLEAFRTLDTPEFDVMTKPRFLLDDRGELSIVSNPIRQLGDLRRFLDHPSEIRELGRFDYWYEPRLYESWMSEHSRACRLLFSGWAQLDRRYLDPDRPIRGLPGRAEFNESSAAFRILTRILLRFRDQARSWGMRPVVLLLPDGFSVERKKRGRSDMMDPLRESCGREDLEVLDAGTVFLAVPGDVDITSLFRNQFHYSAEGNRLVADWIQDEMTRRR